jgi:hypothetical protein
MIDSPNKTPQVQRSLYAFFQTEIARLSSELGNPAPAHTQVYLAGVLFRFSNTQELFRTTKSGLDEEPLAFILKRALESNDEERVRVLKYLGDIALYKSGFFADRIERQGLDLDYYINMGGMAYENVSNLSSKRLLGSRFRELYASLACHFEDLVDVITELVVRSQLGSPEGIMKLYKRWERTRCDRLARKLTKLGFVLQPAKGSLN